MRTKQANRWPVHLASDSVWTMKQKYSMYICWKAYDSIKTQIQQRNANSNQMWNNNGLLSIQI